MNNNFINREQELALLDSIPDKSLVVIYGRRRVGKTRLIKEWADSNKSCYSQAIQASKDIQIKQIYLDIKDQLNLSIEPKSWQEFFSLLEMVPDPIILCIDEFPYLVASDPSLPSILQKWLDHKKKKNITLILSGSSQKMMHDIFLNHNAPLYGRAYKIMQISPMNYNHFCQVHNLDSTVPKSFTLFSLVGGIPKYWEFINPESSVIKNAEELYFNYSAFLEKEPLHILSDENIKGILPISILEAIGRGNTRAKEIAKVIGTPQTNLSRPLQLLKDMSLITREIPFGESTRNTKKTLYKITDPAILFWYSIYSPHRSRWTSYSQEKKAKLITEHASKVFEEHCKNQYINSSRYWEKNIEFDFVFANNNNSITIAEVKYKKLTEKDKEKILTKLKEKYSHTKLSHKYPKADFIVLDLNNLSSLS